MAGPKTLDYPTDKEIELLRNAEEASAAAWDIVLLQDELKEMMAMGEVYSGFTEPPPRFPPTYKRKKGQLEGSCGDYSELSQVLGGFSHIGEELPAKVVDTTASVSVTTENASSVMTGRQSELTKQSTPRPVSVQSISEGNENEDEDASEESSVVSASSITTTSVVSSETVVVKKKERRSSLLKAVNVVTSVVRLQKFEEEKLVEESSPSSVDSGTPKKVRRASMLTGFRSAESIAASEAAAAEKARLKALSKIRPPSYTDRILLHSLSDRTDKLSVTSYGFCDTMRSSDHRPVCMAMELEVRTSTLFYSRSETNEKLNLIITYLLYRLIL